MWIKICGNTNLEDARHAAESGADAVGFVFAPSKRQVSAAQVAAITPHLPATVERVGVFGTRNADEIAGIATEAGLTAVQLHGELDFDLLGDMARLLPRLRIIQVLQWNVEMQTSEESPAGELVRELERLASARIVDRVLIDSRVGAASGGTGIAYNWNAACAVFASAPGSIAMIAAGGLRPENVARAVAALKPWGVDVASGVEASTGRKDPALVEAFIKNARGAETPETR